MPRISFVKNKPTLNAKSESNLMQTLLENHIPVASSCKGEGVCGKCRMRITSSESLPAMTSLEQETLKRNQGKPGERLSCQFKIITDIQVDTDYW